MLFLCRSYRARVRLELDLAPITWVSPLGVVAILSACLAAQGRGLLVSVRLPDDRIARTYLDRIGFYEELGRQGWALDGEVDVDQEYEIHACLPVQSLQSAFDVDRATNQLNDALIGARVVEGLLSKAMTVAVELTQNAREHGSRCYMVAQTHSGRTTGRPGIHVAVADFGPGFAATLARVHGRMTDDEAIVRAFDFGVTGTTDPAKGLGLGYVLDDIDSHSGSELAVISRRARAVRAEGRFVTVLGEDFRGTLATAYFPYTPA